MTSTVLVRYKAQPRKYLKYIDEKSQHNPILTINTIMNVNASAL
jgi:hypothetical protein